MGAEAVLSALGERFMERRRWVEEAAGDRFDEIELQLNTFMVIESDDPDGLFEQMAPGFGITPEQAKTIPMVLAGTIDGICEQLHHHRETYGVNYIVIHEGEIDTMAPVVARLSGS